MCEAWKEYYDEARQDGFKSGKEQGFKTATIEDIIYDKIWNIKEGFIKEVFRKRLQRSTF